MFFFFCNCSDLLEPFDHICRLPQFLSPHLGLAIAISAFWCGVLQCWATFGLIGLAVRTWAGPVENSTSSYSPCKDTRYKELRLYLSFKGCSNQSKATFLRVANKHANDEHRTHSPYIMSPRFMIQGFKWVTILQAHVIDSFTNAIQMSVENPHNF